MPGIFGDTAEDRFHSNELDTYLDTLMEDDEDSSQDCDAYSEMDLEIEDVQNV